MKKFSTLVLGLLAVVAGAYAQGNFVKYNDGARPSAKIANTPRTNVKASDNRATTEVIALDYDGFDENYAATVTQGSYQSFSWEVNKRYSNNDDLTLDWVTVVFDTLVQLDNGGNVLSYPKASTSFTLDSTWLVFNHTRAANANANAYDTLKITVFNRSTLAVNGVGTPGGTLTGTSLWDTTIITNTSLSASATTYDIMTFYPELAFAAGQTFAIRVDFTGDTANKFVISAGGRDDCNAECLVAPSSVGFNTYSFLNWTAGATNQFDNTGLYNNQIYFDCNSSGGPDACEVIFVQNAVIVPFLTATVQYGATIASDIAAACPNEVVTLTANAFGTEDLPVDYAWSTTSGTLTSNSGQQVSLVTGSSNAVVTVTVTDANNVTTTSSFTVTSRAINVTFTNNPQPVSISCGGATATLIASISGNTQGKNYTWSTGATGTNTVSQQVNTPGTYSVTVTNNSQCSATASIQVIYNSGVNNAVSFNPPTDVANTPGLQVCPNAPVTFVNTSSKLTGWSALWNFGNGNTYTLQDGVETFTQGQYTVTLQMDSAGCTFTSAPLTVNVLSAAACVSGINEVDFSNDITLMPNPTTGNVTINVTGIEKNLSIRVYNILGSEVYNFNTSDVATTMNKSIDLSNLNSGTYLVKVQTGSKVAVKRVTVSK